MTRIVTKVTFHTQLALTYAVQDRHTADYAYAFSNLSNAIALTLFPQVLDNETIARATDNKRICYSYIGSRTFTAKDYPQVPLVEKGRTGINIGLKNSFLIKEEPTAELRELIQNPDKANALVRECFFRMPFFSRPQSAAFHYAMDDYADDAAEGLFTEVTVTNTVFTLQGVQLPNLCTVSRHPSLRTERGVTAG
ncbi:MAG: hypothetical protein EON60_12595 [Alphaproteobacteria bacterium]|nr:MAG: hypothetical protein EON60_12595 [Alphaproteobacteria bacterium]